MGNGHFVADLRYWERVGPVLFSSWSTLDADGSTGSGSVQMRASIEGRHVLRRQCIRIIDRSARYRYEFASYFDASSAKGYPSLQFKFHEDQSCSDLLVLYGIVPFTAAPGTWQRHVGVLDIPPGAPPGYSIEIELAMTRTPQGGFEDAIGNIDAIELFDDDRLFGDGFDSIESRQEPVLRVGR